MPGRPNPSAIAVALLLAALALAALVLVALVLPALVLSTLSWVLRLLAGLLLAAALLLTGLLLLAALLVLVRVLRILIHHHLHGAPAPLKQHARPSERSGGFHACGHPRSRRIVAPYRRARIFEKSRAI